MKIRRTYDGNDTKDVSFSGSESLKIICVGLKRYMAEVRNNTTAQKEHGISSSCEAGGQP
jgi:hypothetical protein